MAHREQFGCKKCGAVVTVELQSSSDRVDVRTKDGRIHDSFGKLEIQCKKCNKAVAVIKLEKT